MFKPINFNKLSVIVAIIAFVAVVFYSFIMAADRYTSESRFTIKSNGTGAAPAGLDLGFLGGSSVTKQDQLIIRDYLKSNDMMRKVVGKFGLEALSAPDLDVLWSVDEDTQAKSLLAHYRALIDFRYDEEASVSTVITQGFSADIAKEMNEFLLESAEVYINEFSEKSSNSFIEFAQKDVFRSKKAVEQANKKIRDAQDAGQLVDPKTDLEVVAKTLGELEAQLIQATAELEDLRGVYQDDTYQVTSKKNHIASIEKQIDMLRDRMASNDGGDLAGASVLFAALQFELEYSNASYASALKTLEMAKVQAMQSRKHLVIVEAPNMPDYPQYPTKFLDILVSGVVILMALVLLKGVSAVIREY